MTFKILDPESCRQALMNAEWYSVDEGWAIARAIFLGTVFSMYPSGKYYTPFACGNLDPCEHCGGKGSLDNENHQAARYEELVDNANCLRKELMDKYGAWCNGNWPEAAEKQLCELDDAAEMVASTIECPVCHGVGSEEAYQDMKYTEQLEAEAAALGAYIMCGEGDPCDIFLAQSMDVPTICGHCDSRNTAWLQDTQIECYDCGKITEFEIDEITIPEKVDVGNS